MPLFISYLCFVKKGRGMGWLRELVGLVSVSMNDGKGIHHCSCSLRTAPDLK